MIPIVQNSHLSLPFVLNLYLSSYFNNEVKPIIIYPFSILSLLSSQRTNKMEKKNKSVLTAAMFYKRTDKRHSQYARIIYAQRTSGEGREMHEKIAFINRIVH